MKFKIFITLFMIQFSTNSFSQTSPTPNEKFVPSNSPAVEATAKTTSTTVEENVVKVDSKKGTDKKDNLKSDDMSKKKPVVEIKKPALKKGEYAIFLDEKYEVFTTVEYNKLEIDSKCAKKNGVYDCLAAKSDTLPSNEKIRILPGQTSPAANYCLSIGGEGLIATDYKNDELSFCKFSDKSMVRSWSLHHKLFPLSEIK